jgi:hypothetical protein
MELVVVLPLLLQGKAGLPISLLALDSRFNLEAENINSSLLILLFTFSPVRNIGSLLRLWKSAEDTRWRIAGISAFGIWLIITFEGTRTLPFTSVISDGVL